MTNGCVKCYTSVFCSACYIVLSLWGIIFLGILSALFSCHKQGNIGEFTRTDEENSQSMWIATILYFVLLIVCAVILKYRLGHPFPDEDAKADDDDDFDGTIGAQPSVNVSETKEEQK